MSSLIFSLPKDVLIQSIIMQYLHAVDVKKFIMCSSECHKLCNSNKLVKNFHDQYNWIKKLTNDLTRYAQTIWLLMADQLRYFYINTTIEQKSNKKILMRYISSVNDNDDKDNDEAYYAFDIKDFDNAIQRLDKCSKIIRI